MVILNRRQRPVDGMLYSEVDGNALAVNLLQKVKMKDKGACLYRGNGTKDEGMLWFEQLTIKKVPRVPTTFMTLG